MEKGKLNDISKILAGLSYKEWEEVKIGVDRSMYKKTTNELGSEKELNKFLNISVFIPEHS